MALPNVSMRQLLEAGVHFGHQTHRWNPKMAPFIYGSRNNIHIIDLTQTVPLLHQALVTVADTVAKGGRVLFVGTKRQASEAVADAAKSCAQYYVNHRWLGGTLTNWQTISNSIKRLKSLEEMLGGEHARSHQERAAQSHPREGQARTRAWRHQGHGRVARPDVRDRHQQGSDRDRRGRKLGIPVVAIVDSNCDPDGISHPIPGNDDAGRAIPLYCDLIARAAIDGIERAQSGAGVDLGAADAPRGEAGLDEGEDGAGDRRNRRRPPRSDRQGRGQWPAAWRCSARPQETAARWRRQRWQAAATETNG